MDDEQLDLFGSAVPWEEASVENQEAQEPLTRAQKVALSKQRSRTTVLNYMREWDTPLSAFEISERLRIMKVDVDSQQVRAAVKDLHDWKEIRKAGEPDGLSPVGFNPTRYSVN